MGVIVLAYCLLFKTQVLSASWWELPKHTLWLPRLPFSVTCASWRIYFLCYRYFISFMQGFLTPFFFLISPQPSLSFSLLIIAVVLDGFSLITLLPLCLGGSLAVPRCGVKACAKLAFHLCPKKRWWDLGVFSPVIPLPHRPTPTCFPHDRMPNQSDASSSWLTAWCCRCQSRLWLRAVCYALSKNICVIVLHLNGVTLQAALCVTKLNNVIYLRC